MRCVLCEHDVPDGVLPDDRRFCVWCGHPTAQPSPYRPDTDSNVPAPEMMLALRGERNQPPVRCLHTKRPLLNCATCGRLYRIDERTCRTKNPRLNCFGQILREPLSPFPTRRGGTDRCQAGFWSVSLRSVNQIRFEVPRQTIPMIREMAYRYGLLVTLADEGVCLYTPADAGSVNPTRFWQSVDFTSFGRAIQRDDSPAASRQGYSGTARTGALALEMGHAFIRLPDQRRSVMVSLADNLVIDTLAERALLHTTLPGWWVRVTLEEDRSLLLRMRQVEAGTVEATSDEDSENEGGTRSNAPADLPPPLVKTDRTPVTLPGTADEMRDLAGGIVATSRGKTPVAVLAAGKGGVFLLPLSGGSGSLARIEPVEVQVTPGCRWERVALRDGTLLALGRNEQGKIVVWSGQISDNGAAAPLSIARNSEVTLGDEYLSDFAWSGKSVFLATPTRVTVLQAGALAAAPVHRDLAAGAQIQPGLITVTDRDGDTRLLLHRTNGTQYVLNLFQPPLVGAGGAVIGGGEVVQVGRPGIGLPGVPRWVIADNTIVIAHERDEPGQTTILTAQLIA